MKPANITNIHQAKTHFSKLLERVAAGEEIVIARAGKPVARLIKYEQPQARRRCDVWRGRLHISDDFDAPLPKEVDEAFHGRRP